MRFIDIAGSLRLLDVTGKLVLTRTGRQTTYLLDQRQLEAWMPRAALVDVPPLDLSRMRLVPALPSGEGILHACTARQRGRSEFLLWAEAGKAASFAVRVNTVGRNRCSSRKNAGNRDGHSALTARRRC